MRMHALPLLTLALAGCCVVAALQPTSDALPGSAWSPASLSVEPVYSPTPSVFVAAKMPTSQAPTSQAPTSRPAPSAKSPSARPTSRSPTTMPRPSSLRPTTQQPASAKPSTSTSPSTLNPARAPTAAPFVVLSNATCPKASLFTTCPKYKTKNACTNGPVGCTWCSQRGTCEASALVCPYIDEPASQLFLGCPPFYMPTSSPSASPHSRPTRSPTLSPATEPSAAPASFSPSLAPVPLPCPPASLFARCPLQPFKNCAKAGCVWCTNACVATSLVCVNKPALVYAHCSPFIKSTGKPTPAKTASPFNSAGPTARPTRKPTIRPTPRPTTTAKPATARPATARPEISVAPTSAAPSASPASSQPTRSPSIAPTPPRTLAPSSSPLSRAPSSAPTASPATARPTTAPRTVAPSLAPDSATPTQSPTYSCPRPQSLYSSCPGTKFASCASAGCTWCVAKKTCVAGPALCISNKAAQVVYAKCPPFNSGRRRHLSSKARHV